MTPLPRRGLLQAGLLLPLGWLLPALRAAPTPACDEGPTPPQTPGPFYQPRSPRRQSLLEAGIEGERLVLSGRVLDTDCRPLAGALLDFCHADARGAYDNRGYRLRGHQYTDDQGHYRLETIRPGLYPGRTRHIHVLLMSAAGVRLTTQLYFPGEAQNARDWLFRPELLVGGTTAAPRFDFVLAAG
ncbi:MAG: hypothetical protein R3202_08805 [Candidatus Competibacterales bacterium]|nr:hypothetical protein [Candidatus Competibacterales bacterium]